MKKLLVITLVLLMFFSIVGCKNENKTNSKSESKPQKVTNAKVIEKQEDLIGVWKVTQPLPEDDVKDFGKELGIDNFTTTAVYEWYIELHNDGTTTYVLDYEQNKQSREKCQYTLFYEVLTEAKKVLPEEELLNIVKNHYVYGLYDVFLKGEVPEEYVDSQNYESYKKFFETASDEMKKYTNSPIEEQVAISAMWYSLLEDIGTRFVYKDGEWQPLASVEYKWSFEDGIFKYDLYKHDELTGTTDSFTLNGEFFKNSTWARVK